MIFFIAEYVYILCKYNLKKCQGFETISHNLLTCTKLFTFHHQSYICNRDKINNTNTAIKLRVPMIAFFLSLSAAISLIFSFSCDNDRRRRCGHTKLLREFRIRYSLRTVAAAERTDVIRTKSRWWKHVRQPERSILIYSGKPNFPPSLFHLNDRSPFIFRRKASPSLSWISHISLKHTSISLFARCRIRDDFVHSRELSLSMYAPCKFSTSVAASAVKNISCVYFQFLMFWMLHLRIFSGSLVFFPVSVVRSEYCTYNT